ncbi:MAG TPA: antibiotic biosynthesis monooxygenase [Verrucomicrobiae bacterium]|nr:antibiotic biosynthesis monooxygenase [Verrucomicrobiae bacterium]
MLVRRFTARATAANAPRYYAFFRDTLAPQLRQIPGHGGALVLSHSDGSDVNITVLTFWDSRESIRAFAGDAPNKAVVEPEARGILTAFDDQIEQLTVELDLRS